MSEWTDNKRCANEQYSNAVTQVGMFSQCFDSEEQYKFNNEQGLNTYFDPFLKLLCVARNNAPNMDYYYI